MKFDQKNFWNIVGIIFIVCAVFMGYFVFGSFDKGLVMNDEAYYLMHFRDYRNLITVDSTNYFRIFQIFYTDNIHHFRIISFVLLNTTSYLLFVISALYFKLKINPLLFGFLGICLNMITWAGSAVVLNQYLGNTILINLSLSFLLLFMRYRKLVLILISGSFLGIMCFNGIPHVITIGPIAVFIIYNYYTIQKKAVYIFFTGILVGILFYFTFIEDLNTFISQFEYFNIYREFHKKQMPLRFFVIWFAQILGFIFVPVSVFIFIFHKKVTDKKASLDKFLLIAGIIILATTFFFHNVFIYYSFLGLLIYRLFLEVNHKKDNTFLVLLYLIPFGLSFGSNIYFNTRGVAYEIYFFLALNIIIIKLYSQKIYLIYLAFFLIAVVNLPNFLSVKGWKDFVYNEQIIPVKIDGHNLYLDAKRNKDIEDLRPYLENQNKVIYSSNHLMGYLYILHARPPVPYYFTLRKYVEFMIEKKGDKKDDYIYLESDDYPFYSKEIVPLQFVNHPETYKVLKAGRFTIYLPSTFQKK